jgi:hypothetical protein
MIDIKKVENTPQVISMNTGRKVPIARHSVQTLGGMSPIISYRALNRLGVMAQ